jgi:hypothetical protein
MGCFKGENLSCMECCGGTVQYVKHRIQKRKVLNLRGIGEESMNRMECCRGKMNFMECCGGQCVLYGKRDEESMNFIECRVGMNHMEESGESVNYMVLLWRKM